MQTQNAFTTISNAFNSSLLTSSSSTRFFIEEESFDFLDS